MENMDVIGGEYVATEEDIRQESERYRGFDRFEVEPECMDVKYHAKREDFDLISVIGKGGYGKVMLVRKNKGIDKDMLFAMKIVKKASIIRSERDIRHARSERNILESVKHPFIVDLSYAFQTQHKLYLILEYVNGGELFTYLERTGHLGEPDCRFYASELILALEHLHINGIVYRDLKPENILLSKSGHIKLTDFGLSKEKIGDSKTHTFCGTIEYIAPEIVTRSGHDYSADWWSLGTVMYDMLTGAPPFVSCDRNRTIDLILRGRIVLSSSFSDDLKNLFRRLLNRNPEKRLGYGVRNAEPLKEHPFFRKVKWENLLNGSENPPFVPHFKDELDTSFFDQTFTNQPVVDTPCETSSLSENMMNAFPNFSYVAPQHIEGSNTAVFEKKPESNNTKRYHTTTNGKWEIISDGEREKYIPIPNYDRSEFPYL